MQGGQQVAVQGGLQLAAQGGLQLAAQGGLQLAVQGGLQLAMQGGPQLAMQGGLQLTMQGGPQFMLQGSLQLTMQGGPQLVMQGGPQLASQYFIPHHTDNPYYPLHYQPTVNLNMPFNPQFMAHRMTMTTTTMTARRPSEYPDVVTWSHYLANHPDRKDDGIDFKLIGDLLKLKGFIWITQFTSDLFGWKDLQECLGVETSTALLILQYAKEDIRAIEEGQLVFPDPN